MVVWMYVYEGYVIGKNSTYAGCDMQAGQANDALTLVSVAVYMYIDKQVKSLIVHAWQIGGMYICYIGQQRESCVMHCMNGVGNLLLLPSSGSALLT